MSEYFLINCSEDGDIRVHRFSKAQLEREMAERGSGYDRLDVDPGLVGDPMYWQGKSVLIKGEAVTPIVEQVVTKRSVP